MLEEHECEVLLVIFSQGKVKLHDTIREGERERELYLRVHSCLFQEFSCAFHANLIKNEPIQS
jgi:hypothetical protein